MTDIAAPRGCPSPSLDERFHPLEHHCPIDPVRVGHPRAVRAVCERRGSDDEIRPGQERRAAGIAWRRTGRSSTRRRCGASSKEVHQPACKAATRPSVVGGNSGWSVAGLRRVARVCRMALPTATNRAFPGFRVVRLFAAAGRPLLHGKGKKRATTLATQSSYRRRRRILSCAVCRAADTDPCRRPRAEVFRRGGISLASSTPMTSRLPIARNADSS